MVGSKSLDGPFVGLKEKGQFTGHAHDLHGKIHGFRSIFSTNPIQIQIESLIESPN
jgi:hypothetical protein